MSFCILDIIIAYLLDIILGDPIFLPHPVRFIGFLVKKIEFLFRKILKTLTVKNQKVLEIITGALLNFFIIFIVFFTSFYILKLVNQVNFFLFHIVNIYFLYTSFATKCLADEAKKVLISLHEGIDKARFQISMLVGRDTKNLNKNDIVRATIETIAENTVDGVVSPIFYSVLGSFFGLSVPFVYVFKAVSTMDSMIGYKNEKYINFGKISAKTDDVLNFIPARITGFLVPLVAFFCKLNYKNSFKIMLRDRRNHKSPNCAYPESAYAGALDIKIGGDSVYFGKVVSKPSIGDENKTINRGDIIKSIKLLYYTSLLSVILVMILSIVLRILLNRFLQ